MSVIRLSRLRDQFGLGDRDGLAFKLFSSFAMSLFLILVLQNIAEAAMVRFLLHIPKNIQHEMLDLAHQAEVMINDGDMDELSDWEKGQDYTLFVLDSDQHAISGRDMHPHFEFKLRYARDIDTIFDNEVNQPIIAIPLQTEHLLVIQFPHQYHPARYFAYYFMVIKIVIAGLILSVLSLLLTRYLQAPLRQLQAASHRLAEGDFSVRVGKEVGDTVTEFAALANSFDHMTRRIDALSEKQKRLIRDVSHELKTPLARHDLALHLLKNKLSLEQQPLLYRLERESDEMNVLVSEILDYSRLENASERISLMPVDLCALCQHQVSDMQDNLNERQSLAVGQACQGYYVQADQRLVLRMLKNLIGNAIKYAGEQAQITVSLQATKDGIELWVEDDGQGIPPQHIASVFDPFTRLQAARDKKTGGYGLGLAIVKESMTVMKGKAIAENLNPGFRVRLQFRQ
ncbi:histidine kinase sensor domain-containing protein [Photobacterium nomapromontoriensis]|uniref:histidine kinase sensor domain-containing protein n=1 Tax=Photobacterium nomapromontoriensis TaxID=2910237 RepID=UPI003D0E9621